MRASDELDARALEIVILTAARAGEAVGADWSEIAFEASAIWTWTMSAARMKMRRKHRVPLSEAARAVLEQATAGRRQGLTFPASRCIGYGSSCAP